MLEAKVEARLVYRAHKAGGEAYKFVSPGRRNVPDRIVVLPGGVVCFVECKRPGERPRAGQQRELERLRALGFRAEYVDTLEAVDRLMDALTSFVGGGDA